MPIKIAADALVNNAEIIAKLSIKALVFMAILLIQYDILANIVTKNTLM